MADIQKHLDYAEGMADEGNYAEAISELVQAMKELMKKLSPISHCSECGMLVFREDPARRE